MPPFRTILILLILVSATVLACSGGAPTSESGSPGGTYADTLPDKAGTRPDSGEATLEQSRPALTIDDIEFTAELVSFADCETLLGHLRTWAAERVGPWGFRPRPYWAYVDYVVEEAGEPGDSSAFGHAELVEGVDFSGTNVQEADVDEADIVKTDGRRIFTLSSGRLVVVDVAERRVLGSTRVAPGWWPELFLEDDAVLLIQAARDSSPYGYGTVVQRIDLHDGVPEVVETMYIDGGYVSARSINGTARLILRSRPLFGAQFVEPESLEAEPAAAEANRSAVLASTLDDWLPRYTLDDSDGTRQQGRLTPCDRVHPPTQYSGFGVTTVLSVPVDGSIDPAAATSVVAPGDVVYASVGSLYVSTFTWIDPFRFEGDEAQLRNRRRTNIHRFDISDPRQAVYAASGDVPGYIHNQFSLSEHAGHLRVVSTVDAESHVWILRESDGRLTEVGHVGDIGRGEEVQSVRFAGDVGYVVTFRQIDPFYTVDLSDPHNPSVLGELKIPGFSSYLHPVGNGLVLGVGADGDESGRITGAKVSLFDVSDLAEPREVAVWTAPGWSGVGWDHRAFLWWAPESLAVIPIVVDDWFDTWSGAVVLRALDGEIEEAARVVHLPDISRLGQTDCRRLTETDVVSDEELSLGFQHDVADTVIDMLRNPKFVPDLAWVAQACTGDWRSVGLSCSSLHWYDDSGIAEWILGHRLGLSAEEFLILCWVPRDSRRLVVRSIVIEEELWTLSHEWYGRNAGAQFQVNDLDTLEHLATVGL